MHLNTVSVPFAAVSVLGFASFCCATYENGLKIVVYHLKNINKNTINETETSPTIIFDDPNHSQVFRTAFEAFAMILILTVAIATTSKKIASPVPQFA